MRAADLKLEDLLDFRPEEGKIFLNNSRAILFYADAMGTLRKDLITTLGMDRAKGFLIRYGYSLGYNAAISIKENFNWENDLEWIFAGPVMLTLEGCAMVTPVGSDVNRLKVKCFRKGTWSNSFEVEQHLKYFGVHNEPVCWMLVGYAGGYASAYMGKKVIYKEVKCVGQGDEFCLYVGRTIEEWGDEINSELPYYEVSKINEELDEAHRRIKVQHESLKRAVCIHEQLTQRILKGEGIKAITKTLGLLMNCAVVVETNSLKLLAKFTPPNLEFMDSEINGTPPTLFKDSLMKEYKGILIKEKRPVTLVLPAEGGATNCRLIAPILVGQDILGFVSMVRRSGKFKEVDFIAVEHAATVFALEMMREKEIAEVERKMRGDFLDDLLMGSYDVPESIINRAKCMNYDISSPHRVLVIEINDFSSINLKYQNDEQRIHKFKTKVLNIINQAAKTIGLTFISASKSDSFIMLVDCSACNDEEPVFHWAQSIQDKVSLRFPHLNISIGIGMECQALDDYRNSYNEALKSLDIMKMYNKKGQIASLAKLGAHAIIFHAANKQELTSFATRMLRGLLEYDLLHSSQLINTLRIFLNNNGSIEKTAKVSAMSVSGLKYRLQRIEEINKINLNDAQVRFNLQLALNIFDVSGDECLVNPNGRAGEIWQ